MKPALLLLILLAPLALAAQRRSPAPRRATTASRTAAVREAAMRLAAQQRAAQRSAAIEISRLRFTAAADMERHAYASAAHAYQALLLLAPGDAAASADLGAARWGACRDAAWTSAASGRFTPAAAALAACPAPPPAAAAPDVALLQNLAAVATALQGQQWNAAAAAMAALPADPLPAALDTTLAPAWARFGHGDARAAAALARPVGVHAAALAVPFAAFLRNRFEHRLWHRAALPALAAYLLLFLASLAFALRRRAVAAPAAAEAEPA